MEYFIFKAEAILEFNVTFQSLWNEHGLKLMVKLVI